MQVAEIYSVFLCDIIRGKSSSILANLPNRDVALLFEVLGSLDKQIIQCFSVIQGVLCDIIRDKLFSIQADLPNNVVAILFEVLGSPNKQVIPSFTVIQVFYVTLLGINRLLIKLIYPIGT